MNAPSKAMELKAAISAVLAGMTAHKVSILIWVMKEVVS